MQESTRDRRRTRIVRPYPNHSLEDALEIAEAIQKANAGLPFDRELLARVLGTTPASSSFIMRLNASTKYYGLTQGGYNDEKISLTSRGQSIVAPKGDNERRQALVGAALEPDVFRGFYQLLDDKQLPEDTYARNLLQRELGIHSDLTTECLEIIKANGILVGILTGAPDMLKVRLDSPLEIDSPTAEDNPPSPVEKSQVKEETREVYETKETATSVFVGYAGEDNIAQHVASVLGQFGIPHSLAKQTAGNGYPISPETASLMRQARAAIIILAGDSENSTTSASETNAISADIPMAYLLGAASVLYGERLVVLRESDLKETESLDQLQVIEFQKANPEGIGLSLLGALHKGGIINIGI